MNKQLKIVWFYDNILTNNSTAICKKDYNKMNEQKYLINNEKLMKEWDWEENNKNDIVPYNKTIGSRIRVHWICSKCHNKWQIAIKNRASKSKSTGCPKCAKK